MSFLRSSNWLHSRLISDLKAAKLVDVPFSHWLAVLTCLGIFYGVVLYHHSFVEVFGLPCSFQFFFSLYLNLLQKVHRRLFLLFTARDEFSARLISFVWWWGIESHEIIVELSLGRVSSMIALLLSSEVITKITLLSNNIFLSQDLYPYLIIFKI